MDGWMETGKINTERSGVTERSEVTDTTSKTRTRGGQGSQDRRTGGWTDKINTGRLGVMEGLGVTGWRGDENRHGQVRGHREIRVHGTDGQNMGKSQLTDMGCEVRGHTATPTAGSELTDVGWKGHTSQKGQSSRQGNPRERARPSLLPMTPL